MIPSKHRLALRSHPTFRASAKTKHFTGITLKYLHISSEIPWQVVVIIGKKCVARSTQRNALRRKLMHSLYRECTQQAISGVQMVIIVTKQYTTKQEIHERIQQVVQFIATTKKTR